MGVAAVLDWMVQDGERLATCRHDHPFAVLGPQPSEQGWTVRMWMPEAQTVTLLQAGEEIAMTTPNHPWVFEAQLNPDPVGAARITVELCFEHPGVVRGGHGDLFASQKKGDRLGCRHPHPQGPTLL